MGHSSNPVLYRFSGAVHMPGHVIDTAGRDLLIQEFLIINILFCVIIDAESTMGEGFPTGVADIALHRTGDFSFVGTEKVIPFVVVWGVDVISTPFSWAVKVIGHEILPIDRLSIGRGHMKYLSYMLTSFVVVSKQIGCITLPLLKIFAISKLVGLEVGSYDLLFLWDRGLVPIFFLN
jgi:hypothetical protein